MRSIPILVLLFLTLATPALATDGVLEISQICAVQTGCFSGDSAGFPVTINGSAGHSYRLTSDLTVPNENTDGIVVSANDVGIDLNNFAILGPVTCSGSPPSSPVTCTPATGTGSGVSSANRGTSVKSGSITGMGSYGVLLNEQGEVTNLRVRWNRFDGIHTGPGSTIAGNTVYQNQNNGAVAIVGSTISGNTAYQNGGDGINGLQGSTISGNTAYQNMNYGIAATSGSTVSGNTAYGNGGGGIGAGSGVTIIGNTASLNGDTSLSTTDDGIQCSFGCIVRGNSVRANSGYGLNLGTDSAYSDNVVTGNTTGTVTGAGSANGRGGNYCAGTGAVSANCP